MVGKCRRQDATQDRGKARAEIAAFLAVQEGIGGMRADPTCLDDVTGPGRPGTGRVTGPAS